MHNSNPLMPSIIKLRTRQGIQQHLQPRLTYRVENCQHRISELQWCQQPHQWRRQLQGCRPWCSRHIHRWNQFQPRSQPTIIQIPNNCAPNQPQSNWNLLQRQINRWTIVLDTAPPIKVWEFIQKYQRKESILLNSLIYGAPQDLKSIHQYQYWTKKLANHRNITSFAVTQDIKTCGTHPIPMKLGDFSNVLVTAQVVRRSNVLKGIGTLRVIKFDDNSQDRRKEICHTSVVCEVRPNKDYPNHTHITVAGNSIWYPGNVATLTGSLELLKLIINTALSFPGARFACFDIKTSTWILLWTAQNMQG